MRGEICADIASKRYQYKPRYACFKCRKAFKQVTIEDFLRGRGQDYTYRMLIAHQFLPTNLAEAEQEVGVTLEELQKAYQAKAHLCPECKEPMADMGRDFKPPRNTDKKAWAAVSGLYRIGTVWYTCGCNGVGYIPNTPNTLRLYLEQRQADFQECLTQVQNNRELGEDKRLERYNYWNERLAKIDAELRSLK